MSSPTPPAEPARPGPAPARATVRRRGLGRVGLVAVAVLLLVVGGAAPAQAHVVGIGGRASNYHTDVLDITPPVAGLTVRILEAGNQLELLNHSSAEVVVLGYRSEPYLRVTPTGVYENQRSPSAYANRFANAPSRIPADLDPAAPPQWRRIRNQPDAVWHDHRTHWSGPDPPAVTSDRGHRQVVVPNWQIPLRLGQRTALIEGDIVWVPGPAPWPWALLAVVAFAAVLAAGWRGQFGLLAALVLLAVAADIVHTAGAFAASTAPLLAKAYAAIISAGGWAVAVVALWQLRRGRLQAGRMLLLLAGTFLAFAGALPDVGALASSQISSTLDPALSRAAIALTLGVGLGMIATSLLNPGTIHPTPQPHSKAG